MYYLQNIFIFIKIFIKTYLERSIGILDEGRGICDTGPEFSVDLAAIIVFTSVLSLDFISLTDTNSSSTFICGTACLVSDGAL